MGALGFKMRKAALSSRRDFLQQGAFSLAASALHARSSAASSSNAGSNNQQHAGYIDAHVHVWTDDVVAYPLKPGVTKAEMKPASFTPEYLLKISRPSGVTRIVLVQMSYYGFDNSYMLAALAHWPEVFRGIGIVNTEGRHPDADMLALASKGVRGFRLYPREATDTTWLAGPGFDKMFKCGAKHRLAMCLLTNPGDLGIVDRKCLEFPETPVVIDHMGRVGKDGPILESDVQALCGLARHANVKVKLSAFYALGEKKPPHSDLIPLIRRLYDVFGPQRLMWASDCPFQVDNETYEDSISLVRDRLDFLSPADKEWILRRTAEETFFKKA
jgi:predicted TIM-barrel fold metal-dependent hydrolase